jgi:hypothetical protein
VTAARSSPAPSCAPRRPAAGPPAAELPAPISAPEPTLNSESRKQKNREAFPFATQIIDELREVLGEGVRIEWAEENGQTIGKKGPDGVRPTIEKRQTK